MTTEYSKSGETIGPQRSSFAVRLLTADIAKEGENVIFQQVTNWNDNLSVKYYLWNPVPGSEHSWPVGSDQGNCDRYGRGSTVTDERSWN